MSALMALRSVSVARGGRRVLEAASLALEPGERVALVGANGAGKTTILRTLIGLERPSAGEVWAFGAVCRSEADFQPVRAKAGFLFQDPDDQLFCPTVLDDVAFGPLNLGRTEPEARAIATRTLDHLGLASLADRITHHLSGGEKRLVSIAAVLAMDPQVLLLDEPTNALDDSHHRALVEILATLPQTLLIVSHDRPFIERLATRVLVLKQGRVSEATMHRHPHVHQHVHIHGLDADHGHGHSTDADSADPAGATLAGARHPGLPSLDGSDRIRSPEGQAMATDPSTPSAGQAPDHGHSHSAPHAHPHSHAHTHEHHHHHDHWHRHGDLVHAHPHDHTHSHDHAHGHDHSHGDDHHHDALHDAGTAHDHVHGADDHGPHDHDH